MARAGGGRSSGGSHSSGSSRSSSSSRSFSGGSRSAGRSGGSHPSGGFRTNGSFSSGSKGTPPRSGSSGPRPGSMGGPRPGGMGGPRPGGMGGPGMPPPPPPRPRRRFFGGFYGPGPAPRRRGGGCLTSIIVVFIILIAFGIVFSSTRMPVHNTSYEETSISSDNVFVPLDGSAVKETAYYTDDLGWISDSQALEGGLSYFYSITGIQPYIYLTGTDYSTDDAIDLYYDLFDDEGHFLFVLYGTTGDDGYDSWYVTPILGDDAADAFDPYWDTYWDIYDEKYDNQELTTEEVLSLTFRETADEISRYIVTGTSPNAPAEAQKKSGSITLFVVIILIVVVIVVVIIAVIVRSRKSSSAAGGETSSSGSASKDGGYILNGEYHSYDENK